MRLSCLRNIARQVTLEERTRICWLMSLRRVPEANALKCAPTFELKLPYSNVPDGGNAIHAQM